MSADDLLRDSAHRLSVAATGAAELTKLKNDALFNLLATRVGDVATVRSKSDDLFRSQVDPDDLVRSTDMTELGRRIFARWSLALHQFLCTPSKADQDLRDDLLRVICNRETGGAALLAGGIVAIFGASPAVAMVVGALVMKIFVAPTAQELCATWQSRLNETSKS